MPSITFTRNNCFLTIALALTACARAAPLTWDGNDVTAPNPNGGSGTWDVNNTLNWWNGAENVPWPALGGTDDDAVFGDTAGTVTLAPGGITANDLAFNTTGYTLQGAPLTLNGTTPTISTGTGVTATVGSVISGSSGLTKAGDGTLVLPAVNNYTGNTTVGSGMLQLGTGAVNGTVTSGLYPLSPGSVLYLNNLTAVTAPTAGYASRVRGSGTLRLNSAQAATGLANWGPNAAASLPFDPGFTGTLQLDKGRIDSSPAGLGGMTTMVLNSGSQFLAWTGIYPQAITMAGDGWGETGQPGALRVAAGFNAVFNGNITLTGNTGINSQDGNSVMTINGGISGGFSVAKHNAGMLILTGANTYSGTTTINAGTVRFAKTQSLYSGVTSAWTDANLIVNSGTTAAFNAGGAGEFTASDIDILKALGTAAGGFKSGAILGLDTSNAGGTFLYGSGIANTGAGTLGLAKLGTGTLSLTGINTYTGTTSIAAGGTLQIGGAGQLNAGAYAAAITNPGTLQYSSSAAQALSGGLTGAGGTLIKDGTGTLTLSGTVSYNGPTSVSNGTLELKDTTTFASATRVSGTGALTSLRTVTGFGSRSPILGPNLSGTGILNINNGGAGLAGGWTTVGVANGLTMAGTINVNTGTFSRDNTSVSNINTTATVNVAAGAAFAGGRGGNSTIGALNGAGDAGVFWSGTNAGSITLGHGGASGSFSGILHGSGTSTTDGTLEGGVLSLIKIGAGTQVLSGANTYSGPTSVNGGVLQLDFAAGGTANILSPSSAVSLGGGTLEIAGGAGEADTQGHNGVSGYGTVLMTPNGASGINVTLGAIGSGLINFAGSDATTEGLGNFNFLTTSSTAGDNGTTRLGAHLWNGTGWASTSSSGGNHVVQWVGAHADLTTDGNSPNPTGELRIVDGTAAGTAATYGADTTVSSLLNSATTFASTLDPGANTLTVGGTAGATGAIAVGSPARALTIGATSNQGSLTAGISGVSILALNNQSPAATLTVNSVIMDNAGGGAVSLNTTGPVLLGGNNSYTGGTTIAGGTLRQGVANALPPARALIVNSAGTFDLNAFNASVSTLGGAVTGVVTDNAAGAGTSTLTVTAMTGGIDTLIKDGAARAVALRITNENGNFLLTNGLNAFSGGITLTTSTAGTRMTPATIVPGAYGTGAITVGDGPADKAQIFLGTPASQTLTNPVVSNTNVGTDRVGTFRIDSTGNVLTGQLTANLAPMTLSTSGTGAVNVTGRITGPNGLMLLPNAGFGTLLTATLSNAAGTNDYAGDTIINQSPATLRSNTLVLGAPNQIPNGAGKGNVTVNTNGTGIGRFNLGGFSETINGLSGNGIVDGISGTPVLTVGDNDATSTFTGVLQNTAGALAVTKTGTGSLTLTGASTYAGATTVSAGSLLLNAGTLSTGSAVSVAPGSTFGGRGTAGSVSLSTGGILQGGVANAGSLALTSLTFGGSSPLNVMPVTGTTASVAVSGAVTTSGTQTLNITNTTPLASGSYRLISFNSLGGAGIGAFTLGSTPVLPPGARLRSYSLDTTTAPASYVALTVVSDSPVWTGNNNGNWDTTTTGNWKLASDNTTPTTYFNADSVQFNDPPGTRAINITGADVTPSSIIFNNSTGNDYTISGSSAIAGITGLTKSGTGKITITTSNTYTGATTVSGGILEIGDGTTNGVIPGNIANTANVTFNNGSAQTYTGAITGTGGSLAKAGAGTLTLTGANAYTGGTTISGGALQIGNGTVNGTIGSGAYAVAAGAKLYLNYATAAAPAWSGMSGAGTVELNSAQAPTGLANWTPSAISLPAAFTGTVQVDRGRIHGNSSNLGGTTNIVLANGAQFLAFDGSSNSFTYPQNFSINGMGWGEVGYELGALRVSTLNATFSGAITLTGNSGLYTQDAGGSTAMTVTGPITDGGAGFGLTINATALSTAITLSNPGNSYGGATTVAVGRLKLGAANVLPDGPGKGNVTVTSTLDLNSFSETINGLSGTGVVDSTVAGTPTLTVGNADATSTFGGSIRNTAGTVALTKTGSGTLTLSGANTYSGDTTVNGGTFDLATGGSLVFKIGASGVNNRIGGTAAVTLNGEFRPDLSAATTVSGNTWTLVDMSTLTATFGATFSVQGFTETAAGVWTKAATGNDRWTFTEIDGKLTYYTKGFATWAADHGIPGQPAAGDFDHDGLNNVVEYALGLDPTQGGKTPGTLAGGVVTFEKGAEAIANGDVTYIIEVSTDMGQMDPWTAVVTQTPPNASPTISYTIGTATSRDYVRLRVSIP